MNHFIEVDKDDEGNYYLVIHSGSRNLGNQIAKYYQDLGYKKLIDNKGLKDEIIKEYTAAGRQKEISEAIKKLGNNFVNKQLAYVEGQDFEDYLHDMRFAQLYARLNRNTMASIILRHMHWSAERSFMTKHNYIDITNKILRKGAISAKKGEQVLIPINMRDGSILAIGKGNEDWNCSAPHGAGRLMSRSKAKESLSIDEFKDTMSHIWTTSVKFETLDESPMAYKPIEEIINNIGDTVDIVKIIKPVYNFKAN